MGGYIIVALVIASLALGFRLTDSENYIHSLKQEAYQRGHMVECLGKSGYYWECE